MILVTGGLPDPGFYLRIDGTYVSQFNDCGSGTVNLQYGATDEEKIKIIYNGDKGMFCIESLKYPRIFLRMDCSRKFVNCQYGALEWEMFSIRSVLED